jgi:N utilization substance protein A
MEKINLVESFSEFKEVKNIDRATLMSIIEDVFRSLIKKKFISDENFDIIVNPDRGDLEIWRNRTIVDDEFAEDSFDYNENIHISLSDSRKIEPDFEIGEEVTDQLSLEDFGRRSVLAIRQNLVSRILDLEKDSLYKKYKDRVGDIITGEVYQTWKKETLILDDEGNELILPKSEQIPSDFFKKGDSVRAVVARVEMKNNSPVIILSRTSIRRPHHHQENCT